MKSITSILLFAALALALALPLCAQPPVYTSNTLDYNSYTRQLSGVVRTYASWDPDLWVYVEGGLYSPSWAYLDGGYGSGTADASAYLDATATGPGPHRQQGTHYFQWQWQYYYLPNSQSEVTVPGSPDPPIITSMYPSGSLYPGESGSIFLYGWNLASCFGPTYIDISGGISTWGTYVDCQSPTSASTNFSIPGYVQPGEYTLTLSTPYGSDTEPFTVGEIPNPPRVGGIIVLGPTTPGSSGYVEIYGYDLAKYAGASSVDISGVTTGVSYQDPTNPYQINIWYSIPANATPGPRPLVVNTPYGSGSYDSFTVTQ